MLTCQHNYQKLSNWTKPEPWKNPPGGFWEKYFVIEDGFNEPYTAEFGVKLTAGHLKALDQKEKELLGHYFTI